MSPGRNPQSIGPVTAPIPTGVTSISPRAARSPRVDGVRRGFEATFGAYVPADWTLDAECTRPGTDPEVFYPSRGGPQTDRVALAICAACTVREVCLEDAIAYETGDVAAEEIRPEVHGVRGGMVSKDRRRLIQQRKVEAANKVRDAALADYLAGEMRVGEIALKHGVDGASLSRWAKAAGHPIRPKGGGRRGQASQVAEGGAA